MKMNGIEHGLIGVSTIAIIFAAYRWVKRDNGRFRRPLAVTMTMTFVLVMLGAYVRLADAGLGCPDWPGCYGNLVPDRSTADIHTAEAIQPGGPLSMAKAWKEMVHRYLAMVVGARIGAVMLAAWRNRRAWNQSPTLATLIAGPVIFQAALGAWTVTMLLKPAIVTSHLLGGITILALVMWLYWRQATRQTGCPSWASGIISTKGLRVFALLALTALLGQIALGGLVSTNYAALACAASAFVQRGSGPPMDFANAFHVVHSLGIGADGKLLTAESLRAIH